MKKVMIIGHYGGGKELPDGQTVKTQNFYRELLNDLGEGRVGLIDTMEWKKNIVGILKGMVMGLQEYDDILIVVAHNGVRIFIPLLVVLNRFFKKRIHYGIVGAWLPDMLSKHSWLKKSLKKLTTILAETNVLKEQLVELGLTNVTILKNFKRLELVTDKWKSDEDHGLKMCTFSRVMEKKGIGLAIEVTKELNNQEMNKLFTLDIYGMIDSDYQDNFMKDIEGCENISYRGVVASDKSTEVLSEYDVLLFPTLFETEGIPGTIIDAYASGLPVIASKWNSFQDIITEGETGLGFELGNKDALKERLLYAMENRNILSDMSSNSIEAAKAYLPDSVMKCLYDEVLTGYVDN